MPNTKNQRPKQHDSVNAHRVDRINRFRAINLAKGREALALKRAAPPSDNHHRPPDVGVPSPVAGTSKDHSPPQSRGYHPPYKVISLIAKMWKKHMFGRSKRFYPIILFFF